jgi:hypothetical protein
LRRENGETTYTPAGMIIVAMKLLKFINALERLPGDGI